MNLTGARRYAIPVLIGAFVAFVAVPLAHKYGAALVLGIEAVLAAALIAGVWWWDRREAR